jgi:peptidase E
MKLFLCSNFKFLAKKYLPNFFDLNEKHTCLLIGYADESGDFFSERSTKFLESLNFDVIHLSEGYEFNDKIDMVFVKGGNTTQLVHLLRKFNQFEKVRNLVLNGSVFAGQSAGAVLAGIDTEWTLRSEPYEIDVKQELGEYALLGFGFVDKLVFVHCSKLRFPFESEIELAGTENFRVKNTLFYGDYL